MVKLEKTEILLMKNKNNIQSNILGTIRHFLRKLCIGMLLADILIIESTVNISTIILIRYNRTVIFSNVSFVASLSSIRIMQSL